MYKKFTDVFNAINEISSSVGNEALYNACAKADLNNENDLCGMMWLIGRSYAASPQRRSYGMSFRLKYKGINKDGKPIKRPIWRVRTENSGNGDFFLELARNIKKYSNDTDNFNALYENIETLSKQNNEYKLQINDKGKVCDSDIKRLSLSIKCVSILNRLVKRGTEWFDCIPKDHVHSINLDLLNEDTDSKDNKDYVYCKNQISFSSKFLHFFSPTSVFIIDQFSKQGGDFFFDNKSDIEYIISNGLLDDEEDENNAEIIKACLTKEDREQILKEFGGFKKQLLKDIIEELKTEYPKDKEEIINLKRTKKQKELANIDFKNCFIKDYVEHCVNSYVLCLLIKQKFPNLDPKKSYPRLSDTIFMRTKKETKKDSFDLDEYKYYQ